MRSKPLFDRVARTRRRSESKVNGLDRDALDDAIRNVPARRGQARFRAQNRWLDGGRTRTTVRDFRVAGDEEAGRARPLVVESDLPGLLSGDDAAMAPFELVLAALASCITTTLVWQASVRGVHLDAVETDIEGDIDLAGSLGIDDSVSPGYRELRISVKLESDVQDAILHNLVDSATRLSPVLDTVGRATIVRVTRTGEAAVAWHQ